MFLLGASPGSLGMPPSCIQSTCQIGFPSHRRDQALARTLMGLKLKDRINPRPHMSTSSNKHKTNVSRKHKGDGGRHIV